MKKYLSQTSILSFSGAKRFRSFVLTLPATEKTCSHDVEVGWIGIRALYSFSSLGVLMPVPSKALISFSKVKSKAFGGLVIMSIPFWMLNSWTVVAVVLDEVGSIDSVASGNKR